MKTLSKIISGMGALVVGGIVLSVLAGSSSPKVGRRTAIDHYSGNIPEYKVSITEEFRGSSSKRKVVLEATGDASDLSRISGNVSGGYFWDDICFTDSYENTMCQDFSKVYEHGPGSEYKQSKLEESSDLLDKAVRAVRNEEHKIE